jgi:hypothetical protein
MPFDSTPSQAPTKVTRSPTLASRLRAVLGEHGEHWVRGGYATFDNRYCVVGALRQLHGMDVLPPLAGRQPASYAYARDYNTLRQFIGTVCLESWNDKMSWRSVDKMLRDLDAMLLKSEERRLAHGSV